jgi:hypothetical protein
MSTNLHPLLLAPLVWLAAVPATAHHSLAPYDLEREITIRGQVTRLQWTNPHVYIYLETEDDSGAVVEWAIEGPVPGRMSKQGWSSSALSPGDRVTVVANPPRSAGRRTAYGQSVLKRDGTVLNIPGLADYSALTAPPATPFVANGLNGYWLVRWDPVLGGRFYQPQTSLPLTPEGVAAIESYNDSENPVNECVPEPLPWSMFFPSVQSIEIGDDVTTIRSESAVTRTVYMDGRSHDGAKYLDNGHSIGWWEGDVLVIETTHFAKHRRGNAWGLPSGPRKHFVERFALNPAGTGLTYTFQLDDPDYLAEPVTGALEFVYRPDLPLVEVPCDRESARRHLQP